MRDPHPHAEARCPLPGGEGAKPSSFLRRQEPRPLPLLGCEIPAFAGMTMTTSPSGRGRRAPARRVRVLRVGALCGRYPAAPEFRSHGLMDSAGLCLRASCVRVGRFRPVARVPRFHCPFCQLCEVGVFGVHRPTGRKKVAERIEVVAEREGGSFQDQSRLQSLLCRLLGEGTDMAWRGWKGIQQMLGDIEVVSGEPQPAERFRYGRFRVAHRRPFPLGGRR